MAEKCKICGSNSEFLFTQRILRKYDARYFYCERCEFMQTEKPYWLQEAYESSMNLTDCGILLRNIYFSRLLSPLLFYGFDRNGRFVDYAGGYGVLTRLMRDIGFDFLWYDPYTTNILAKGFEYKAETGPVGLVTAFETFEHFEEPLSEIEKLLALSPNVVFSTALLPKPIPGPNQWWYYGLEHGQHIALYSLKTLQFLAGRLGSRLYSNSVDFHVFTKERLNPLFFKYLPMLSKYGLFFFVRSRMKSRTADDMHHLIMQETNRG